MNIILWILQALLALLFLLAGGLKIVRSREQLRSFMQWVETTPAPAVKLIGVVEVLGAAGLILPAALHIAVILTPLAALGLVIVMAGAVVTHLRMGDRRGVAMPGTLLILCAVVALLRFGPYHF